MLLMNRPLRDKIPGITQITDIFKEAKRNDEAMKAKSKKYYDETKHVAQHAIQVGDSVLLKQKRENKLSTAFETDPYEVVRVEGPAVTINRGDQVFTRNAAHLKVIPQVDPDTRTFGDDHPVAESDPNGATAYTRPVSTRIRRAPDRYTANWIQHIGTLV